MSEFPVLLAVVAAWPPMFSYAPGDHSIPLWHYGSDRKRVVKLLLQNLRYSARQVAPDPVFYGPVITLLGDGANTAIFSVVNAVLLRACPLEFQVWYCLDR